MTTAGRASSRVAPSGHPESRPENAGRLEQGPLLTLPRLHAPSVRCPERTAPAAAISHRVSGSRFSRPGAPGRGRSRGTLPLDHRLRPTRSAPGGGRRWSCPGCSTSSAVVERARPRASGPARRPAGEGKRRRRDAGRGGADHDRGALGHRVARRPAGRRGPARPRPRAREGRGAPEGDHGVARRQRPPRGRRAAWARSVVGPGEGEGQERHERAEDGSAGGPGATARSDARPAAISTAAKGSAARSRGAWSGVTRPVASARTAPSDERDDGARARNPRARAGRHAAPHAMRPTKSAVRGTTYRAWGTARWYSRPATRVKDAPVQRRMPDAVASGIQVGISPKSRGERARPSGEDATATERGQGGHARRRPAVRPQDQPEERQDRDGRERRDAARGQEAEEQAEEDGGAAAARRLDTRTKSARATSRRKTRGASGPASRLASVWIGERATMPPAQAAAHGPAICPGDQGREGSGQRTGKLRRQAQRGLGRAGGAGPEREPDRVEGRPGGAPPDLEPPGAPRQGVRGQRPIERGPSLASGSPGSPRTPSARQLPGCSRRGRAASPPPPGGSTRRVSPPGRAGDRGPRGTGSRRGASTGGRPPGRGRRECGAGCRRSRCRRVSGPPRRSPRRPRGRGAAARGASPACPSRGRA